MKRTIYHSNISENNKGRIINALLAFLTANRYSVIFTFRITIVKRNYQEHRLKERILNDLYIFLVLFPIFLVLSLIMQKCGTTPVIIDEEKKDSTEVKVPIVSAGASVHPLHEAQGAHLLLLHSTITQPF